MVDDDSISFQCYVYGYDTSDKLLSMPFWAFDDPRSKIQKCILWQMVYCRNFKIWDRHVQIYFFKIEREEDKLEFRISISFVCLILSHF